MAKCDQVPDRFGQLRFEALSGAQLGDMGDELEIDEATRQANDVALDQDNLMISQYRITPELVLIVKTSEDHQTTVVQLPEERDLI